jgi:hypothetical protein
MFKCLTPFRIDRIGHRIFRYDTMQKTEKSYRNTRYVLMCPSVVLPARHADCLAARRRDPGLPVAVGGQQLVCPQDGRGQKARVALVDQARLAEARKQLEDALGSLASFEVLTGESDEDKP